MKIVRSIANAAETILSVACWMAPGPRCPRILLFVLAAVLVLGVLSALFYRFSL